MKPYPAASVPPDDRLERLNLKPRLPAVFGFVRTSYLPLRSNWQTESRGELR